MSREVDERVVQMQFDNAQFERGTRQTMGTLEKLKQSLQFKGVEKGFERISSASQKVDFSEMTKALESIESKFSAVNVIAVTALTSITNKAIATGERLVKALSLDPIISGFQEYETQINAVQTILANTSSKGTTLDQVNAALDELNHYADLTIYNFTEMTRNIGTFTAAGVDLDTSVAAIKGIANLAAVSGSTSQQASTAMYQLSQALASGTVKLQDWNSVVNAGIGQALFTLGTVAIQTIIDLIAWAWDGGGGEGGGIKGALSSLWANITSFIGEKFNPANWFKEGSLLDGLFGAANKAADERDATEYGKSVGDKLAEGMNNSQKDVRESSVNLAKTVEDATRETAGINSPSTMMEENGYWLDMGLAQGMEGSAGMAAITAACGNISSTINSQFRDYWGIHSPSTVSQGDASNILAGMCIGFSQTDGLQNSLLALNGGIRSTLLSGMDTTKTDVTNKATNIVGALSGVFGGTTTTAEDILKTLGGSGSTTTKPTTTGHTSPTKKTGKTLAEQIAENYSKKLKANKYLLEAADKEYSLWEAREGDIATNEQITQKRSEYIGTKITRQTSRVKIAQEQYDELLKRVGKNNDKTREAYNTLMDEQATLENLQKSQYEDTYSDLFDRYDDESSAAENEYSFWSSKYEKTATAAEKSNKQIELINKKIGIQAKALTTAEEEYTKTKDAFGEESRKTQEAYARYLKEQIEYQQLVNSLNNAELDRFDKQNERYALEMKTYSNQQSILLKLFEDGDYGVVTSTINMGAALRNMSYQLKRTTNAYDKYNEYVQAGTQNTDDGLAALHELQDERYSFIGYAEAFADALNMSDDAKKVTASTFTVKQRIFRYRASAWSRSMLTRTSCWQAGEVWVSILPALEGQTAGCTWMCAKKRAGGGGEHRWKASLPPSSAVL